MSTTLTARQQYSLTPQNQPRSLQHIMRAASLRLSQKSRSAASITAYKQLLARIYEMAGPHGGVTLPLQQSLSSELSSILADFSRVRWQYDARDQEHYVVGLSANDRREIVTAIKHAHADALTTLKSHLPLSQAEAAAIEDTFLTARYNGRYANAVDYTTEEELVDLLRTAPEHLTDAQRSRVRRFQREQDRKAFYAARHQAVPMPEWERELLGA